VLKHAKDLCIPVELADLCNRKLTALLVYDMQVGICSQVAGGDPIVERCAVALPAARRAGMRVAFTRHLYCPKTWMGATQYRSAMAWQKQEGPAAVKPWFPRDATATAIVPSQAPTADDLVLDKLAMSAFEGTPLAFALRDCGITGLAICGIAVEIGIESTTRHATDLGFIPVILRDACGSEPADAGERSIETMRFLGEAMITDVGTFGRLITSAERVVVTSFTMLVQCYIYQDIAQCYVPLNITVWCSLQGFAASMLERRRSGPLLKRSQVANCFPPRSSLDSHPGARMSQSETGPEHLIHMANDIDHFFAATSDRGAPLESICESALELAGKRLVLFSRAGR
jgi:biuret amidohydrolase